MVEVLVSFPVNFLLDHFCAFVLEHSLTSSVIFSRLSAFLLFLFALVLKKVLAGFVQFVYWSGGVLLSFHSIFLRYFRTCPAMFFNSLSLAMILAT